MVESVGQAVPTKEEFFNNADEASLVEFFRERFRDPRCRASVDRLCRGYLKMQKEEGEVGTLDTLEWLKRSQMNHHGFTEAVAVRVMKALDTVMQEELERWRAEGEIELSDGEMELCESGGEEAEGVTGGASEMDDSEARWTKAARKQEATNGST